MAMPEVSVLVPTKTKTVSIKEDAMKRKTNTYQKIQAAMRAHNMYVLGEVREANLQGRGWRIPICPSLKTYNAMERCEASGVIVWHDKRRAFDFKQGWWLAKGVENAKLQQIAAAVDNKPLRKCPACKNKTAHTTICGRRMALWCKCGYRADLIIRRTK